jgi:protein-tyrosine-phosphatase
MSFSKRVLVASHANGGFNNITVAYLRCYGDKQAAFESAVVEPQSPNGWAIKVMAEDNIDITSYQHVLISDLVKIEFDYAIVLKEDGHPVISLPALARVTKKIQITVASTKDLDPEQTLVYYRETRERIKKRVLKFIGQELMPEIHESPK